MSGIEKMVEWLELDVKCDCPICMSPQIKGIIDKAKQLLAEEQAQKPKAPAGLMDELRSFESAFLIEKSMTQQAFDKILSRYKPQEHKATEILSSDGSVCVCEFRYSDGTCHVKCSECNPEKEPCPALKPQEQ